MRFGRVPELGYEWMPLECPLHDAALNTLAAAVDHANFTPSCLVRGVDVLLYDRRYVTRCERMQVDVVFDRNAVRHRSTHYFADGYEAVTTVLIPPRTEKSPTTVMRRGAQAATRSSRIWLVTAS